MGWGWQERKCDSIILTKQSHPINSKLIHNNIIYTIYWSIISWNDGIMVFIAQEPIDQSISSTCRIRSKYYLHILWVKRMRWIFLYQLQMQMACTNPTFSIVLCNGMSWKYDSTEKAICCWHIETETEEGERGKTTFIAMIKSGRKLAPPWILNSKQIKLAFSLMQLHLSSKRDQAFDCSLDSIHSNGLFYVSSSASFVTSWREHFQY